ncbi:MAG: RDD family protein [Chloroflexi bacterium]|nr:RDD family protein [Chloroflexota bacterium]
MGGNSPGLRPLTFVERHITWMYGFMPAVAIYTVLLAVSYFLTRPDINIFLYFLTFSQTVDPVTGRELPINVQMMLARGFYLIAYFTWGRSTGHLLMGAHVIDRKTGRRMTTWQKLVRGSAQMLTGSLYIVLDGISLILVLLDRQERRSVYDWLSGTVVVMGDLPPEEETVTSRSWVAQLIGSLRRGAADESR